MTLPNNTMQRAVFSRVVCERSESIKLPIIGDLSINDAIVLLAKFIMEDLNFHAALK